MASEHVDSDQAATLRQARHDRWLGLEQGLRKHRPEPVLEVRGILARQELDATERAEFVRLVRWFPGAEAEDSALDILAGDPSEVVQRSACAVLLQCGGDRSLLPLAKRAAEGTEGMRAAAGFAHVVISHRLHRPSPFLRLPRPEEGLPVVGPTSKLRAHPLTEARRAEVVEHLEAGLFTLGTYEREGLEFQCGKTRWTFLLLAPATAATLRQSLGRSPSVLGIAARLSEEHRRWTVARIVLSGPAKPDRCYLAVFRRDGTLDLHGSGALEGGVVQLLAAARPGAVPVSVQATLATGLSLEGTAGLRRVRGRSPTPAPGS